MLNFLYNKTIFAYFSTFLCHILILDNVLFLTTGANMGEIRMVKVNDVCKTLPNKSKPLLRHVNFSCGSGEIAVITGANGTGKSTLMKIMAGLVKPDSGSVKFNNDEITSMSGDEAAKMRCSKIGYASQNSNLVSLLTVEENIILPNILSDNREKLGENIRVIGENVEALKNKPVSSLSGGETKMVMLSRIFYQKPDFILLDEPTDGVDDNNIKHVFYLIYYFAVKLERPVVIVSHDSRIIDAATKVYTLNVDNSSPSLVESTQPESTWLKTGVLTIRGLDGNVKKLNMSEMNNYAIFNKKGE